MKRALIAILMAAVLLVGISGCKPAAATDAATQSKPTVSATAPASQSTGTAQATLSAIAGDKDYASIGGELMASEAVGSVRLDMTLTDLVKALGEPDTKTAPELWGADGLEHMTYNYSGEGLVVDLSHAPGAKDDPIVASISAVSPCKLATARGIKLGDTEGAVMTAYSDAIDPVTNPQDDGRIIAGSEFGGVVFTMKDGKVSAIFIGASAE